MWLCIHIREYKDTKYLGFQYTNTLFRSFILFIISSFDSISGSCCSDISVCGMGVFKLFPQIMFMAFRPATSSAQPPQLTKEIATYPKTLPQNRHPLIQGKTATYWFLKQCSSSVHTIKVKFMMQSIFECNLCINPLHHNFYKNVGLIRHQVDLLGHRKQMQYERHHGAICYCRVSSGDKSMEHWNMSLEVL